MSQFEWAHFNASGGASVHKSREEAEQARDDYLAHVPYPVDDPPRPASDGIWVREVYPWRKVSS